MLIYLIVTILFWAAGACMLKWFMLMIEQGGALDVVFGWQKMLHRLYNGTPAQELLGKALGDCIKCTSFWFMPIWFACYYIVSKYAFHHWITDTVHNWICIGIINMIWYCLFHGIGGMIGFYAVTKLFK